MTTTLAGGIKRCKKSFVFFLSIVSLNVSSAFAADGAKIFKQNCAVCHRLDAQKLVGPGFAGLSSRVPSDEWLFKWIKNNDALRKSGDAYALKIFQENGGATMTTFDGVIPDEDIKTLIAFIKNPPKEVAAAPVASKVSGGGNEGNGSAGNENGTGAGYYILGGILVLLVILAVVLRSVKYSLLNVLSQKKGEAEVKDNGWWCETIHWLHLHKRTVAAGVIFIVLGLSKMAWDGMMGIGVFTGYKPEQPIQFSHKIHAGDNAINCQYCHSSVEKSRHAGIPSLNICMNCHKGIDHGPVTGTAEIAKIYAAIGWDPATQSYDEKKAKGIKWTKVHNLQDFVFFSHQQHVKVGKLDCSNCHGDVRTMTVAQQVQPLTMGWCIDCHRKTEVPGMKVKDGVVDNPYYEELHKKLAEKYKGQKITVDKMGGIECAKCHY
jgi:cytochrome c2